MRNNNNILVTGGAGYIGSQICKELKKKNLIQLHLIICLLVKKNW